MEKYALVMRQTIDLADTCLEGMEHIHYRLRGGYFNETYVILGDVVEALHYMDKSFSLFGEELPSKAADPLKRFSKQVFKDLHHVIEAYEKGIAEDALDTIEFKLLPHYRKWKIELDKCFHSYVLN
ncbi:hypothetical protein [Ammoniphilus sp. YIM 78166]|uniref:hypothetical protein n=1 Tax=Ammoniphilus sp. YIM 78166 TaxID=1644106 RepID=UPI0010704C16|nr:hypothetical protein [Ammoniphilus sp. YIM 78166]